MIRTKFGLQYLDGPPIERLGLVILALGLKQNGEVVVADRNVGMILAESFFTDLDGPPKERLGLVILALVLKQIGEVVVAGLQRWDDPCREPFHRSRWPADRAARPGHTCPGPEADWRGCCIRSQRRDDPCREPFRRSRWPVE